MRQFSVFAGAGAIGTAVHYAVLLTLVEGAGADPIVASTCGFAVGAAINYRLNYRFTFASSRPHAEAAPRFALIALLGAGLNAAVVFLGTHLLGWRYLGAQIAATGLVLGFNFTANRLWTFGTSVPEEG